MKDTFQETIDMLERTKHDNLKKLIELPFEKLKEMESYYYEWYKGAEESNHLESAEVNYLKYSLINEAIIVKTGNEEQAWDYLT